MMLSSKKEEKKPILSGHLLCIKEQGNRIKEFSNISTWEFSCSSTAARTHLAGTKCFELESSESERIKRSMIPWINKHFALIKPPLIFKQVSNGRKDSHCIQSTRREIRVLDFFQPFCTCYHFPLERVREFQNIQGTEFEVGRFPGGLWVVLTSFIIFNHCGSCDNSLLSVWRISCLRHGESISINQNQKGQTKRFNRQDRFQQNTFFLLYNISIWHVPKGEKSSSNSWHMRKWYQFTIIV